MVKLLVWPRPVENLQNVEASVKKLKQTGPAQKERVASAQQSEQLARTPEPPLPTKRERVKVSENCNMAKDKRKLGNHGPALKTE